MNIKVIFHIMDYMYEDSLNFPKIFEAIYLSKYKNAVVKKYEDYIQRHPFYIQHLVGKEIMMDSRYPKSPDTRPWKEQVLDELIGIEKNNTKVKEDMADMYNIVMDSLPPI